MASDRRARLHPPRLRRTAVVRPRLIVRLRERFTVPIAVVVAPAGFGKTTLLAQAVAENRLVPHGIDCWLSCSPDDAAASSLATGLGELLDLAPTGDVDEAAAALAEAVWHRSPTPVALVLDDVHEIPPGSPGAELLDRLVAGLPTIARRAVPWRRERTKPVANHPLRGRTGRIPLR